MQSPDNVTLTHNVLLPQPGVSRCWYLESNALPTRRECNAFQLQITCIAFLDFEFLIPQAYSRCLSWRLDDTLTCHDMNILLRQAQWLSSPTSILRQTLSNKRR